MNPTVIINGGKVTLQKGSTTNFSDNVALTHFLKRTFGSETKFASSELKHSSEQNDEDLAETFSSAASTAEQHQSKHIIVVTGKSRVEKTAEHFNNKWNDLPASVEKVMIITSNTPFDEDPTHFSVAAGAAMATDSLGTENIYICDEAGVREFEAVEDRQS